MEVAVVGVKPIYLLYIYLLETLQIEVVMILLL